MLTVTSRSKLIWQKQIQSLLPEHSSLLISFYFPVHRQAEVQVVGWLVGPICYDPRIAVNVSADQRDPPQSHRPFHIQLRNVAANQGNHPLSATLHCWHILDCGIGCWLHILIGMPGFVMKYVSLRTYLHARECHHVFNNRDQSLVPCFILAEFQFSEHQPTVFCFPNHPPVVESGCLPITEHCPL